jgi:hypothetical protein
VPPSGKSRLGVDAVEKLKNRAAPRNHEKEVAAARAALNAWQELCGGHTLLTKLLTTWSLAFSRRYRIQTIQESWLGAIAKFFNRIGQSRPFEIIGCTIASPNAPQISADSSGYLKNGGKSL